jgi:hypothetical protein
LTWKEINGTAKNGQKSTRNGKNPVDVSIYLVGQKVFLSYENEFIFRIILLLITMAEKPDQTS